MRTYLYVIIGLLFCAQQALSVDKYAIDANQARALSTEMLRNGITQLCGKSEVVTMNGITITAQDLAAITIELKKIDTNDATTTKYASAALMALIREKCVQSLEHIPAHIIAGFVVAYLEKQENKQLSVAEKEAMLHYVLKISTPFAVLNYITTLVMGEATRIAFDTLLSHATKK